MPAPFQFAKLKFDPSEPKSANGYTPEHSTVVVFDDFEEARIYFSEGLFSTLQKGDTVACEYSKNKWRLCQAQHQAPELIDTLKARHSGTQTTATPTTTAAPARSNGNGFEDIAEMAVIVKALQRELSQLSEAGIVSLAQSIFKYRKDGR